MVQVQLRIPEESVSRIDEWVDKGRFRSRSDAVKTIIAIYEERVRTREFYKTLIKRSDEVKDKPELLVPLDEV